MANTKTVSTVLLIVGVVVLIVSVGADALGLGGGTRFGGQQILGAVAGLALIVIGIFYSRR
jgi:hypothetical protein